MHRIVRYALLLSAAGLIAASGATATSLITGAKVKNNSLTGKDVKDKSLSARDFKGSIRGPQGPAGPAGSAGAGSGGAGVVVVEAAMILQPGDVDGPQAFCPAGKVPVGTGFYAGIAHTGFVESFNGNSVGAVYVNDTSIEVETKVQAICAGGGGAVAASASSRTQAKRAFASKRAKMAAQR